MTESKGTNPNTRVSLNLENFQLPDGYEPASEHRSHQKSFISTRTALHRGHKIKIETTYRIEIDGEPLGLHTMVIDDGSVHCHGLPNYAFSSAIDLVKSIIDSATLASIDADEIGNEALLHQDDADQHESNILHRGENH